jgi:hypothetical protein
MPGKHPITVKARSLLCYWAVRKLGFSLEQIKLHVEPMPAVIASVLFVIGAGLFLDAAAKVIWLPLYAD